MDALSWKSLFVIVNIPVPVYLDTNTVYVGSLPVAYKITGR